jgi:uncharacterized membrane protein YdfJ with MMPL/SSD domain
VPTGDVRVQPDGGVGLAAAVVIDGGVVRLLLVPAFMMLASNNR